MIYGALNSSSYSPVVFEHGNRTKYYAHRLIRDESVCTRKVTLAAATA